jgi:hypothetical protein
MALDSRLIDLWDRIDVVEKTYYEITPSGKYFVFDQLYSYEVSTDGMILTINFPGETAVFNRVGDPATSLLGEWSRTYTRTKKDETETWIYKSDGTYVGHWDSIDWFNGFYEDTGDQLRTVAFRGNVTTESNIWHHDYDGNSYEYRYEFNDGDNNFSQFNRNTNILVCTFRRRLV